MNDSTPPLPADHLAHLHPDHARVGRAGIFALDGNYATNTAGQMRLPVGFVGILIDVWNGWAVFRCTRDVADAIIADQQRARETERARLAADGLTGDALTAALDESISDMYWDDDVVVTDNRRRWDEPDAYQRSTADEHGHYIINGWDWTWSAVDPADCDRIAGTPPAPGDEVAFVPLHHTDMSVPHGRLKVTDFKTLQTPNGTAFIATLCRDYVVVATIENGGNGGGTWLRPGPAFNAADMESYVRGCRLRGQTPAREQVLQALVDEYRLGLAIDLALNRDGTLVRLRDDDGNTLAEGTAIPSPRNHEERQQLAAQLRRDHRQPGGTQWQIWRRGAWQHLGRVTPDDTQ